MSFIFVDSGDPSTNSNTPSAPQTTAAPALTPTYIPQPQGEDKRDIVPNTSSNSSASSNESSAPQTPIPQSLRDLYEQIQSRSLPADHVPIEIFLQLPGWYKYAKANLGFGVKRAAIAVTNVCTVLPIRLMNINPVVGYAASTSISTIGETFIGGDVANFPDIPVSFMVGLLSKVTNRKALEKISVKERTIPFKKDGYTGYEGVLIIKDLAHGERLVSPGAESIEISNSKGKNPLDRLVALKDGTTPMEWFDQRFVRTTPSNLRKIPYAYKDDYVNSCLIFELPADPDVMLVEAIRKPKEEFEDTMDAWNQLVESVQKEGDSTSDQ